MTEHERELLLRLTQVVADLNPGVSGMLHELADTVVTVSGQEGWLRSVSKETG